MRILYILYCQHIAKGNEVLYENSQNPYETKRMAIAEFMQKNSTEHIDIDKADVIKSKAEKIIETGIKMKDAYHVACAIYASCDYFLTTDDRLLKYHTNEIQMLNPVDLIRRLEDD